ncbi:MAG TPA: MTH938/NDUFAF3 family protein [Hyphomicrobium sp.]|nr:MTH938/NDUFAF3 family protein [Hyphomicrobium sp.]
MKLEARYPYEAAVTAYGNGGFRFADMSHRGSILCLPSGVYAWEPVSAADLTLAHFARVLSEMKPQSVLLLGTGMTQVFPAEELIRAFAHAGIGLEPMSTGAAARTYNILLAEKRAVGAALIAVD